LPAVTLGHPLTGRLLPALVVCACAGCAVATSPRAQDSARAFPAFAERVRAYVDLQETVERALPEQRGGKESERVARHQHALAAAVADARPDAKPGDVFEPAVNQGIRAIVADAFHGSHSRNMRRTIADRPEGTIPVLHVNAIYPDDLLLTTMPPTLLRRLPFVPDDVAYRIIGRALVLQDAKTGMIVDVIVDAIPQAR